jgi:HlyD family secretion protein
MRTKIIFGIAIAGVLAGLLAAYLFGRQRQPQQPVFTPVENPFPTAIYANGIIESDQSSGSNVNVYPEVSGRVVTVLAHEGQAVRAGTPLVVIDPTVQQALTEQARAQADAALALLKELKAEPRRENLEVAVSQVALAAANLKAARDQYDKRLASYRLDPHSISKDVLDTSEDAVAQAQAAEVVAQKQLELTRAGA